MSSPNRYSSKPVDAAVIKRTTMQAKSSPPNAHRIMKTHHITAITVSTLSKLTVMSYLSLYI